ncbi:MAG: hypothetical protein LBU62_12480 [Bacteroidales bacterium]|jgi:hypothetical protein|nr:hypothetical protein [Bacteroidales bacterium]
MAIQTNPVQQRMEYLADMWNDLPIAEYKIICAEIDGQDIEMMNAFHWYMLGTDTPIEDLAIIFESEFADPDTYSLSLVRELEGVVNLWNEAEMPKGIDKIPIEWKPDYSILDKNKALLFVDNLNRLAEEFPLRENQYVVANLLMPHINMQSYIRSWIRKLLDLDLSPNIKILLTEVKKDKTYDELLLLYPKDIYLWKPDIDTANVICQTASMGDPLDSGTDYRSCFARLMKTIGEQNYKKTLDEGEKCIKIAADNITKDPYWIAQVVTVYVALSNEDYRFGKEKDAFLRADKAITTGKLMPDIVGNELGCSVVAQAQLNKASLFCFGKQWKDAYPLFKDAADNLVKSNVFISALESYRMAGFCADKTGYLSDALDNLYKGYRISENIENETLQRSTFPFLIYQLKNLDYKIYISEQELNERAKEVLGDNWEEIIRSLRKRPDLDNLYADNPYITEPFDYQAS